MFPPTSNLEIPLQEGFTSYKFWSQSKYLDVSIDFDELLKK